MSNRKLPPAPAAENREIFGIGDDGKLRRWCIGRVVPLTKLERQKERGRTFIKSGHYLIGWNGHEVAVHLGNKIDGRVSVLFMCSGLQSFTFSRRDVESLLIGKIVQDPPTKEERYLALKRMQQAVDQMLQPYADLEGAIQLELAGQ